MKGWLISSSPEADPGDTTPWNASFWEFCASYCTTRFGEAWHLSPEQSLLLYAENTVLPKQVIVYTPRGANNRVELLFDTSLYDLKQKDMPPHADLTTRDGLRLFVPEAALIKVPEAFFARNPVLFRTLFDDGFPGLFHAIAARISDIIRSLPERRAGAHSV